MVAAVGRVVCAEAALVLAVGVDGLVAGAARLEARDALDDAPLDLDGERLRRCGGGRGVERAEIDVAVVAVVGRALPVRLALSVLRFALAVLPFALAAGLIAALLGPARVEGPLVVEVERVEAVSGRLSRAGRVAVAVAVAVRLVGARGLRGVGVVV